jgi:sec-independent protein translocase protein TatA
MLLNSQSILAIGLPQGFEWVIILVVALMIFGKRLPDVARNVGKSLSEFKKGIKEAQDVKDDVQSGINDVKKDVVDEAKKALDSKD